MEYLVALAAIGGAIVGCGLLMVITQLIERHRDRNIYYIYQDHIETAENRRKRMK